MKKFFLFIILYLGFSSSALAFSCGDQTVDFVKDQIISYLDKNPQAADTLEGIHHFWINWPYPESIEITEVSVHCLQDHGILEPFKVGNHILWRKTR